jgi:hypothetical protein
MDRSCLPKPSRASSAGEPTAEFGAVMERRATQSAQVVRRHPVTTERHLDLLKWRPQYWTKEPTNSPNQRAQ